MCQEQIARKERSDYEKQQEKFRRIQQKVEYRQNTISRGDPHGGRLLKKSMHRIKAYEARFEKEFENMTEIPETEEAIYIRFGEKAKVKNGCGKTTLLRMIAEELLNRKDIIASYMPQNYEELLDMKQTPIQFLSKTGEKEEISRICTYLGSMKYTADEMQHKMEELSGGQKAKILLLKMSMSESNVLILDEPTRNFSPLSNPVIRTMLQNYKGAILTVSHDRKYIKEVADRVYELTDKGLIEIKNY